MKLNEANMVAWSIVTEMLPRLANEEVELLPDLAVSVHDNPARIGAQPGAFNALDIASVAVSAYSLVIEVLKQFAPQLFSAGIEMGKEAFKEWLRNRGKVPAGTQQSSPPQLRPVDLEKLRAFVFNAGKRHHLDPAIVESIANAIIVHIVIMQQKKPGS